MKKISVLCISFAVAFVLLTGCLSTGEATKEAPKKKARYARELVDWTGAKTGQDMPEWLVAADGGNETDLKNADGLDSLLAGKYWIVTKTERNSNGIDSKILRMTQEAAEAEYMQAIARTLNAAVDTRFSGVLSSNDDSQKTLTAAAATARFTGFKKVRDGYILVNTTDKTTGKETMTYEVIRIYACPVDVWQKQAAKYIQNLGLNSDSADLKKAASMADELVKDLKPGFAE